MKKCELCLLMVILASPVFADNLYVQGGAGFAKSAHEEVYGIRYQHDTSRLFGRPSFYEAAYLYWTNDVRAQGIGFARSVVWGGDGTRRSISLSAGGMGLSRRTEHLGTSLQFYFRFAYQSRFYDHPFTVDFIHISNGKTIFGWDGHNSGENFLTVSIGLL